MTTTREALESVVARLAEIINQLPDDVPEVPETVNEWPEDDEHLRGEFWTDFEGDVWAYRDGGWHCYFRSDRTWQAATDSTLSLFVPLTRTTDPSLPRKFDSLDDVPDDVERVTAWYGRFEYELVRWPRAESGWMIRCLNDSGKHGSWNESGQFFCGKLGNFEEVIEHE